MHRLLAIFFILLSSSQVFSTSHLLPTDTNSVNIIRSEDFTYAPGDTFYFPSGLSAGVRLIDFKGTKEKPLLFTNRAGKTVINEEKYQGISFQGSQYIQLSGSGSSEHEYGISITKTGPGSVGVSVGSLSSDLEINNVEIANTGFAGIMAKTDPTCDDESAWRRNGFVLENLHIHHNYIHETEGEGMYIGYTGGYKIYSKKICDGDMVFAHWLENVNIHDNLLENCGWDGIQVNLVRKKGVIKNNRIANYGTAGETYQNFGMSIGGGVYEISGNHISVDDGVKDKTSLGMQLIGGESGTKIFNNIFENSASHAIFIHNRYEFDDKNSGYVIANNTIINPGESGVFYNATIVYSDDSTKIGDNQEDIPYIVKNNLIVNPGLDYLQDNFWKKDQESYIDFNNKINRDSSLQHMSNNLLTRSIDTLYISDDYEIANSASALYNSGYNMSSYGITTDILNNGRPSESAYDIGAYEYNAVSVKNDIQQNIATFYPNPVINSITVSPTLQFDTFIILDSKQNVLLISKVSTIDVSTFTKGIYFLKVSKDGTKDKVYRWYKK